MSRIYAVGETILDIIFRDKQPVAARPGGSSFNASVTLGRLGAPVTFISEMGNDRVGDLIQEFLEENGVEASCVSRYEQGQSAISLAFLNDRNDAEYQFYKDYPHQRLAVRFPEFHPGDLLIFGSFYALNPGIRPRVRQLLDKADNQGAALVYDPNFRSSHLERREQLLPVIRENMGYAHIVRASDEDLVHIFGVDNPSDAWEQVRPHCRVLIYTANAHGVHLRTDGAELHMEVERIEPVSTIGAGDTFNAGLLYGLHNRRINREEIPTLTGEQWEELIRIAVKFSREVCLSYDNYLPAEYARRYKTENSDGKTNS